MKLQKIPFRVSICLALLATGGILSVGGCVAAQPTDTFTVSPSIVCSGETVNVSWTANDPYNTLREASLFRTIGESPEERIHVWPTPLHRDDTNTVSGEFSFLAEQNQALRLSVTGLADTRFGKSRILVLDSHWTRSQEVDISAGHYGRVTRRLEGSKLVQETTFASDGWRRIATDSLVNGVGDLAGHELASLRVERFSSVDAPHIDMYVPPGSRPIPLGGPIYGTWRVSAELGEAARSLSAEDLPPLRIILSMICAP